MGEGDTTGAKDVSDKITDEDQLLGAQQKDAEKPEQEKQDGQEPEKDDDKKVGYKDVRRCTMDRG
jgi:hypothetical protein